MRFEELERRLTRGLRRPLPGSDAQLLLAPRPRRGWRPGVIPADCRPGAALLLVYPVEDRATILLTVRDEGLPHHAGQVSLPGGALEPGETVEQGALREAAEEVRLDPSVVELLGRLTPLHVPVSRFALHPVVGLSHRRPRMRARPGEVERIVEARVGQLTDRRHGAVERRLRNGLEYRVPYLAVEGEKVWGATAMVLAEFLSVLGCPPDPWAARQKRNEKKESP